MTNMKSDPLVSIVVRTKDRPKLLNKALASIAAQTYRPMEVVLVNDGGCDLDAEGLKGILGGVSLNYMKLEKNTGRAHAGNVGIENTKGKYVGFLDDDDEFYPEHVTTLVTLLEQGGYKVAYTGVAMVSYELTTEGDWIEDANSSRLIFSKDFSYADLLFANYIPFNSILFEKEALKGSGNMDESLELYEDWDFLIRVAQKNPFYHIKKNTAQYNQWSKELQINRNNVDYMKATQLKVIEKHWRKITPEMILEIHCKKEQFGKMLHEQSILDAQLKETIMEKSGRIAQLEEVVMCKAGRIAQLEEEADVRIAELEGTVRDKNSRISELEGTVRDKDTRISEMEEVVSGKDSSIAQIERKINEKESHIINIENDLNSMRNTIGWKLLEKFRKYREKALPPGTKRRSAYDLSIKSAKYIRREGYRRFLSKVSKQYKLRNVFENYLVTDSDAYKAWLAKNEPKAEQLEAQRELAMSFSRRPKISIVTPVYNTDRDVLKTTVESVINQTYDNWELCLADGASSKPRIKEILRAYSKKDKRIKIKLLAENKGIAGNSNEALSLATGDFVALLDHDDVLPAFALYNVVEAINSCPDADFLYSDEDKISEDGKLRSSPHFKPDWSPDTLRSYNYVAHLSIFRKELLTNIQGFRCGFEGSQDYDLILRATEQAKKIIHIPRILYHWRISQKSTAGDANSKPYAYVSAKKAVQDHLHRIGLKGRVEDGLFLSSYKVVYRHEGSAKVSIIILNRDHEDTLRKCINSILGKTLYKNYEIIIVENNSSEKATFDYYGEISTLGNVKIVQWENPFNFSAANNFGVKFAEGEVLLFMNNDVEVINDDWMDRLLEHAVRSEVGAVGAKLYYPDNTVQHAGVIVGLGGVAGHSHKHFPIDSHGYFGRLHIVQNLSAVTAACLMIRKNVFEAVSCFDEGYPIAFNDVDLCLKVRDRGYLIVWTPYAELYHHESKTRGYEDTPAKQERFSREIGLFKRKWEHFLERGDPYYNPNLTVDSEDFSIRYKD